MTTMTDNTLYIDTSKTTETSIRLEISGQIFGKTETGRPKAQQILPLADALFADNRINPEVIRQIKVQTGPGSFTGLRVGIAVAKTLALLLGIPVNGVLPETDIPPAYAVSRFDDPPDV
jgi:tRNA threonylcarbamoyl adenosine modification protein YeaZ